jgi:phosphopantothenoylcysteine decarboxylase/phosphopantothenate--cysteine ligase
MSGSNILFVLSGSIACYKACDAISQLVQRGHRVRAVATEAALKFVGAATLEGLTREKVAHDLFAAGAALDHIDLVRWANVTVLCPATASTLNRVAAGIGDDLAGALLLAHDWKKPLLIAPAMNPSMWTHPATVASVEKLRGWGAHFVNVGSGRTACGEIGAGRLAESVDIVREIERVLSGPEERLRVLVTSGGTSEPVDGVRVLTNTSTGGTGALVAGYFRERGHDVLLLRSRTARSAAGVREKTFFTFADLDAALTRELGEAEFDVVIHAAAVGDFSVHAIAVDGQIHPPGAGKLSSDVAPTLHLRRNPKLLDTLRRRSRNPAVRVVAFKLTQGAGPEQIRAAILPMFASGAADLVVHNDLAARAREGAFPAEIWHAEGKIVERCERRDAIAPALERLLTAAVVQKRALAGVPQP